MESQRHGIFTFFTALCAAAVAIVFIAIGSTVARLTFTPHDQAHEAATEAH